MAEQPQQVLFREVMPPLASNSNAQGEKFTVDPLLFAQYLVQPSQQFAIGKLYGIGINKAIVNESLIRNNFLITPEFPSGFSPDALPNINGGFDKTANWDGKMSSSLPGMPVMCYLELEGGTYIDNAGDSFDFPTIIFETVIITLNLNKDIKKTKISGRNSGTVKEWNNNGDWQIGINAVVTADAPVNEFVQRKNQQGVYPIDNMHQIWQMIQAPVSIKVKCWFLQLFDINYITIDEGVTIEQVEGMYNVQRIKIPALSNHPLVIRYKP